MAIELIGLKVESVALHEVPAPPASSAAQTARPRVTPVLSTELAELDDDLRRFFEQKIKETAHAGECFEALFIEGSSSPVGSLVDGVIEDTDQLLASSQQMARHLADVQTAQNSPGIVAVAAGTFRGATCVAILKLEHDQGVQLRRVLDDQGRVVSLSVQHVRELLITQKTKLHKQAVIRKLDDDGLLLHVTDTQRARNARVRSARFFLRDFLGAQEARDPKLMTQQFFDATVGFIKTQFDADPERALDLSLDLVAYMRANVPYSSVADFAEQYLEQDEKEPYRQFMAPRLDGMPPRIEKDTDLITSDLRRARLTGASGIVIQGPPGPMRERLVSEPAQIEGESRVTVTDHFTVDA